MHRTSVKTIKNRIYIHDKSIFEPIRGKALFYPASARDIMSSVRLFSPYISDFWFVDYGYGRYLFKKFKPLLLSNRNFEFLSASLLGIENVDMEYRWDDVKKKEYRYVEPCTFTEKYIHIPSGNIIRIHRKREFAEWSFNNDKRDLGVFYYQGDSGDGADGGSGITWFDNKRIRNITDKLCDGGLIVTDGSNRGRSKSVYKQLWKNTWKRFEYNSSELLATYEPFADGRGITFTPVAVMGYKYGPVIAWRVNK